MKVSSLSNFATNNIVEHKRARYERNVYVNRQKSIWNCLKVSTNIFLIIKLLCRQEFIDYYMNTFLELEELKVSCQYKIINNFKNWDEVSFKLD
jgi:hypothetical protein